MSRESGDDAKRSALRRNDRKRRSALRLLRPYAAATASSEAGSRVRGNAWTKPEKGRYRAQAARRADGRGAQTLVCLARPAARGIQVRPAGARNVGRNKRREAERIAPQRSQTAQCASLTAPYGPCLPDQCGVEYRLSDNIE